MSDRIWTPIENGSGGKINLYGDFIVTAPPPKKLQLSMRVCFVNFLRYRNKSRFFNIVSVYVNPESEILLQHS